MTQISLFNLDPVKLKAGKDKCPCCGKLMRAYCKTLDRRLITLAWDILVFIRSKNYHSFNPREVWSDNHHKINDFQKLHYWRIIEKCDKAGWWKMTKTGYDFLMKRINLPREVWIFNNKVIERSEVLIDAGQADPRWQIEKSDWAFDFLPYQYKTLL